MGQTFTKNYNNTKNTKKIKTANEDITYEIVECSSEHLRTIMKGNLGLLMLVPNRDNLITVLASSNDITVGALIAYERIEKHVYINHIHVVKEYRGKGIGSRLLCEIEDAAKQKEMKTLSLHVSKHNSVARSLYRKVGFRKNKKSNDRTWIKSIRPAKMRWRWWHFGQPT